MNTEEVVEMLDAISAGKPYARTFEGAVFHGDESVSGVIKSLTNSFCIESTGKFRIEDPRVAREIAGALVAWANRKDGNATTLRRKDPLGDEPSDSTWRESWFKRNIRNMTQVTMDRNFADLHSELNTQPLSPEVVDDIRAAIKILFDAGAKRRV